MSGRRLLLTVLSLVVIDPSPARAEAVDLLGYDARSRGMGMSTVTLCTDDGAAACNPAGAALAEGTRLGLGYGWSRPLIQLNGQKLEILDIAGIHLGLAVPFKLGRTVRAGFGLTAYLPDQFVARVKLAPAYEPRMILLDHLPHRISATVGFALSPVKWLSLGLGATLLADAAGNGITFNVGVKGGKKVGETAIDFQLPIRVAPTAGLLVRPTPWLRIGAAYRGELDLRLALDILANVDVAGIVTGDAIITMRGVNYFTPHRVEAGVSFDPFPRLTVAAGLVYEMWSRFSAGISDVRILVDLGLNPPMVQAFYPPDNFRDTISPRAGLEYRHDLAQKKYRLAVRGGYAYVPSPVPDQVGYSALVDNTRHVLSAGLGFRIARTAKIYPYPIAFDLGFQYHAMATRAVRRHTIADPLGGGITSKGGLVSLAASLKLEY